MKQQSIRLMWFASLLAIVGLATSVYAQAPRVRAPQVVSPVVLESGAVQFQLLAPNAESVELVSPDLGGMPEPAAMTKNDQGVWSVTYGPLEKPITMRYRFNVDGINVVDPTARLTSEANGTVFSLVHMPGQAFQDVQDVPHGAVAEVTYYSKVLGKNRRMHVYTPPGYQDNQKKYPVFYLLHGSTDSDDSWSTIGRANVILDNLIASGKAAPMVVVMPDGHVSRAGVRNTGGGSFEEEFEKDIRPTIENSYRVLSDRANRAIAGLSMGGGQTMSITFSNLKDYGYIGVFSSGVFGLEGRDGGSSWEEQHADNLDTSELKEGLELIWYATGSDDFLIETSRDSVAALRDHGFEVMWKETEGGHWWKNWRAYLSEFAPLLFKSGGATEADPFCIGADISFMEGRGGTHKDNGVEKDICQIMADHHFNNIRLRLFVNPEAPGGYSRSGACGLDATVAMAKRIKAAGMDFTLDFHYSDTWADPDKQFKPSAWEGLTGEALENKLYEYTKMVLNTLIEADAAPDVIQIGNEINHGMVWPDGKLMDNATEENWEALMGLYKAGQRAVRETLPDAKIMIHLALGGENTLCREYLDQMVKYGAEFDIIGVSYYERWHETYEDLKANLYDLAERYQKPLCVCEYGANEENIRIIADIVRSVPNGMGYGTMAWEPTGLLFGRDGNATEAFKIYDTMAKQYADPNYSVDVPPPFVRDFEYEKPLIGADISWVPEQEARGTVFSEDGEEKDVVEILKDNKFNWIRLRLFVDPTAENGYSEAGFCDLENTLAMAKRAKSAGMKLLLDFHYSDTWADPGKQFKPASWERENGSALEGKVHQYSKETIERFIAEGVTPDMVQVGNEIQNGMIWPQGKIEEIDDSESFCVLLRCASAGVRAADPNIKIMVHIACGGQNEESVAFFDKIISRDVKFDVIGQSYYPEHHGSTEELKSNLTDLATRYHKPIVVVEYQEHRKEVNEIVKGLPDGMGWGTFIWEATSPRWGNLFDRDGAVNENMEIYPAFYKNYSTPTAEQKAAIPHLEKRGDISQLIVKGEPYLALAGELHNSSASSPEYMERVWPAFEGSGLNTILAVVSWDQIEPEEGKFDFSQLDALVKDARRNDLKLVILWFGSFKNGGSGYIPGWVGRDPERFPRAISPDGLKVPCLSVFHENNWEADKKAFAAMMNRIKEIDREENTVLFVQVENEMGLFFERDFSDEAEALFNAPVPQELVDYLVAHKSELLPETLEAWKSSNYATEGTWQELFGANVTASEFFMAWHYSNYINELAEAGKAIYPLPMFVNVALQHVGDIVPGDYPSGGPVAQVHDIWRVGAPAIDFYSPDIYDADYTGILDRYSRKQSVVFVPECMSTAAGAVYLIGERRGIGFSPFGIDGRIESHQESDFHDAYRMMSSFDQIILDHQVKGTIRAAWLSESNPEVTTKEFVMGDHKVIVNLSRGYRFGAQAEAEPSRRGGRKGYAMILQMDDGEYLVMGSDVQVTFAPAKGDKITAFAKVNEGYFVDNQWHPLRWLNGDETNISQDLDAMALQGQSGYGLKFRSGSPQLQRVWLYDF